MEACRHRAVPDILSKLSVASKQKRRLSLFQGESQIISQLTHLMQIHSHQFTNWTTVQIFEQFPRFERAGAVIGVQPNGQRAVEAIRPDLLQSIIDGRMKVAKSIMYRDNGELSPAWSAHVCLFRQHRS